IDDQPYGGTCALRGCNPKRALAGAAELIYRTRGMRGKGIHGELSLDWRELIAFKSTVVEGISEANQRGFAARGIEQLHGHASFAGPNEIVVGETRITARKILIASGSKPRPMSIDGAELMITSDQLLSLEQLPGHVLFVGAGYISMEFAHVIAATGRRVTLVEYAPSPLMPFDRDLVDMLVAESARNGVEIVTNAKVERIAQNQGRYVITASGEQSRTFEADLVVHGAGRIPNVDGLGLEQAGIEHEKYGIKVNEYLQSISNQAVYVAGDAHAEGIQLTPVAEIEGKTVGRNLVDGNTVIPDYTAVPSVVFTHPSLASVGERQSADTGPDVGVVFQDTSTKLISRRLGLNASAIKILFDKDTRRIRGAHLLGHNVDEVINIFALAIRTGMTLDELKQIPWTFPSVTYDTLLRA
ncbi:MAG: NAD(P)/FAD-dependent oxidoreductase, partial [Chitinivibrionales bacterium]|nr:NAD(P)/FAD-dependent oxidoreductase [Chitinivibrionales bacterium]